MKYYHFIVISTLFLITSSCTNIVDIFSDRTETEDTVIVKNNYVRNNIPCPMSKIPYETSSLKKVNLNAKIIRVSSSCNYIGDKNNIKDKINLIVKFSIYINVDVKDVINYKTVNGLNTYIAIINEQDRILTKLKAPILEKDIRDISNSSINIIIERDFKFIYNKNNNNNLKIYYGFQK